MVHSLQQGLALFIVGAAAGYACWRGYRVFKATTDPCRGCAGCELKALRQAGKQQKEGCPEKKAAKKFGRSNYYE